jgi:tetratricopeptide (TPR) repeat protein
MATNETDQLIAASYRSMKRLSAISLAILLLLITVPVLAQTPSAFLTDEEIAAVEKHFDDGNAHMDAKRYSEALASYREALKIVPDLPALLYNGGFAAMLTGDNTLAAELWVRVKQLEPKNWQVRAKLIQAYQRLGKVDERDKEREELYAIRKSGAVADLNEQIEYCRDRFSAGGRDVMAFELFEFKGPRGMRYVFNILDEAGEKEDYRISLGSYDMTNAFWRETTKPKPKKGMRLFHLDGYFRNGAHATYGMFPGEPTYEETKKMVIDILEERAKPVSATIPGTATPKPRENQ